MLNVQGIHIGFDQTPLLQDIHFDLHSDETIVFLGPSGCGKTTLLRIISGMTPADTGKVRMNGSTIQSPTHKIAFILQNFGLLPWKTIRQNVALGLKVQQIPKKTRRVIAQKTLAEMGLENRQLEYPSVLSGGEQQRVAIARAYAANPKLLLMDEPFSALDAITREKLQETLIASWQRTSVPYILVTHSVEEAVFLGRRIFILAGQPTSIKAEFKNPGMGSLGYRNSETYYRLVREIRQRMATFW